MVLRYDIENDRYKQVRSVLRRKKLYHLGIFDDGNLVSWSELSANGESVFYSINDSVVSQALVTSLDTQETHLITYFDSGIERNLGNIWIYLK